MNISAINTNYKPQLSSNQANAQNVAFKGKGQIVNKVTEQINETNKGFVAMLTQLGKVNKESLSTIITAIGTALVAPIFIAFNPISKEDKETKIYSAMRQPISATIALAIQLNVNKRFNNYIDSLASTGQLERADLRTEPTTSYLKRLIKMQQPNLTKEELDEAIKNEQNSAFWKAVDKARTEMKDISKKENVISNKQLVDPDTFEQARKEIEAELKSEYKNDLASKSKKQKAKFLSKHLTKDKIMARAEQNIEKEMNFEAKVKIITSRLKKSGISLPDAIQKTNEECINLREEIQTIEDESKKALRKELLDVKSAVLKKLTRVKSFDQLKMHGNTEKEVLQSVKIKQMIEAQRNNARKVLSQGKEWGAIGLALATLPVSCGILNWAYPRLMEKFMPEIANAKKSKGGK